MSSLACEYDTWELPPKVLHGSAQGSAGDARRVFDALVGRWRRETRFMSSLAQQVLHPAYQQIIGLGSQAVPWLLEELEARADHWGPALSAITREDPVRVEDAGHLNAITRAWLQWGEEHGLR